MQDAIQSYFDIRTANALDLDVEQVRTINRLEERHNADIEFEDRESIRITGSSAYILDREFKVEIERGVVSVSWREDGSRWEATVEQDGSLTHC